MNNPHWQKEYIEYIHYKEALLSISFKGTIDTGKDKLLELLQHIPNPFLTTTLKWMWKGGNDANVPTNKYQKGAINHDYYSSCRRR